MAAKKPPLRVVGDDEVVEKAAAERKTISEAALSKDPDDLLIAMRDRLTEAVEERGTPARDLASLTRRLLEVIHDLDDPVMPWLVLMRSVLAAAVGNGRTSPRDLAALTRRLSEVVREIASIEAASDEGDELGAAAAIPDEEFDSPLTADSL